MKNREFLEFAEQNLTVGYADDKGLAAVVSLRTDHKPAKSFLVQIARVSFGLEVEDVAGISNMSPEEKRQYYLSRAKELE